MAACNGERSFVALNLFFFDAEVALCAQIQRSETVSDFVKNARGMRLPVAEIGVINEASGAKFVMVYHTGHVNSQNVPVIQCSRIVQVV